MSLRVLVVLALLSLYGAAALLQQTAPVVTLDGCGGTSVIGDWKAVTSLSANTTVRQFRGIPFAHPPVGDLRFAAPEFQRCPASTHGGVFNATQFSNPCIQPLGPNITVGSEDCLYLNVYVPEVLTINNKSEKAPVLVYIHGGSLVEGSGIWEPLQFLSAFAGGNDSIVDKSNSAVVVTINYRLAVLGFLATQGMCDNETRVCGNFGIMDQLAALQWVQDHISAFGGDPKRVNIMGQSSGGTSVFALFGSPRSAGLFQSGISLSGSPNITMDKSMKLAQDAPIAAALGCGALQGSKQLECLRNLSAEAVQNAMPNSWNTPALFSNRFLNNGSAAGEGYPALAYVDGLLIPAPVWPSLASGLNGNMTLVFGNMGQECDLVAPSEPVNNFTQSEWATFIASQMIETWPNAQQVAKELYAFYENASNVNPQLAYDSFNADYGMTCATYAILDAIVKPIARTRTAPMYVFVNQWGPQNEPVNGDCMNYAFHTWDYVNAVHNWVGWYTPGEEDLALSRLQRRQWFSVWSNKTMESSLNWPPVSAEVGGPAFFLFSRETKYPWRPTGPTQQPYTNPGVCPYLIHTLGMNQRYWWCN